jgi:large subunit ribosomal protein L30
VILVIRISGQVGITSKIKEALRRINLEKKYSATLLHPKPENLKHLKKLRNYLAYGDIKKEVLVELIKKRAQPIEKNKKIDVEQVVGDLEKKSLSKIGLKPFFRLHPPRKGIDSKKHFGVNKGVLGDNKEKINDLVMRML